MPRIPAIAVPVLATTLALSACATDPGPAAPVAPQTSAQTSAAAASPTVSTPAEAMDAKAVLDALAAAKLPLTAITAQDEETDPNDRLGRPGQYTSRASADVPEGDKDREKYGIDRGVVVEVFATPKDADARAKYIQDTLASVQIVTPEYHYRPDDRRILVRVTGNVKPSKAKAYETAVAAL